MWDKIGDTGGVKMFDKRICPICENSSVKKLIHFYYEMPQNSIRPRDVWIVCCERCGFVFKDVKVAEEKIQLEENRYESFEQEYIQEFLKKEALLISERFSEDEYILDVGCSTGGLLKQLRMMGFSHLYGLDPSEISCRKARDAGVMVVQASIYDQLNNFNNKFQLIILSQVLEHLADLDGCMKQLIKWLQKDGFVYVSVPMEDKCSQYYGNIASLMCSEHVNHFGIQSLDNLFLKYGFVKRFSVEKQAYGDTGELHNNDCTSIALIAIYQLLNFEEKTNYVKDKETEQSVIDLFGQYERRKECSYYKIETLKASKKKFVIWGLTHMAMSRLNDDLKGLNIVAFTDSDLSKVGLKISGVPVVSIEEISKIGEEILVMDNNAKISIIESIKKVGLKMPIHVL